MAGRRKVEWTPEAIRQAEAILTYVRESWGDRIAGRFVSLLKGFELLVLQFPMGISKYLERMPQALIVRASQGATKGSYPMVTD